MFLAVDTKDLEERNIKEVDFVIVTGDAYVDSPSFGTAIIGHTLERFGYSVAVISQPEWKDCEDFRRFGKPRLGFLINSGNMDSMVNHYTVNKKRRKKDAYTAGGATDKRPDRAVIVYSNLARSAYKDVPIIIGGIEASLRRFSHYDYWEDKVRKSILIDSGADLLLYGMGERSIIELAQALESGIAITDLTYIKGSVFKTRFPEMVYEAERLPSFSEVVADKVKFAKSFVIQEENADPYRGKPLMEEYEKGWYVVQNPPTEPLNTLELDDVYEMQFENKPHPMYKEEIAAAIETQFSITSNRGCFGSCSFCALTFHQGRIVSGRSTESMVREATKMTQHPDFKGYIHDVGGPSANFMAQQCKNISKRGTCKDRKCLYPEPCKVLDVDHEKYMNTLRKLRNLDGVKKVFIRSGIRYDYLLQDKNSKKIIKEIADNHVSGQLRVAPEHIAENTLRYMRKPKKNIYERFVAEFNNASKDSNKKQYVVPYFMSSHPGTTLADAIELAIYFKKNGQNPEQVQDFYPTPSTLATCMFYTGLNPYTLETVYVPKSSKDKAMQRALLQFNKRENKALVYEALKLAKKEKIAGYLLKN
ncbi:YgiQ family radical SAM protein [Candidatus Epulonipiscium viviparus]|uniref:YgiQ family radical SAM protein n=1 Tax=Candidatus Epulonipiscium viviparus TaxID=420336 RepID=UPI002738098F|nr:YgiQ family radical SAM protein [Candidatus Epulopiscium viviparus]